MARPSNAERAARAEAAASENLNDPERMEDNNDIARRQAGASGFVVIGCKHPPGMELSTWKAGSGIVPVPGGGTREEFKSVPAFAPFRVYGPAVPFGQAPRCKIVEGFALTRNVPRELAELFFEQNVDSDFVQKDILFWEPDFESAVAHAKENKGMRSGLEQLDPGTVSRNGKEQPADPRWPKPPAAMVKQIQDLQTEEPADG